MTSKKNGAPNKLGPCREAAAEMDCYKLRVDLYKFRAEDYRGQYESMRVLEWKVLFQVYAGYAAIAIAFTYVQERGVTGHTKLVSSLAMAATLTFYLAARYLAYRIQERLIRFNQTLENYLTELDSGLQMIEPRPGTKSLGHQYYWTYHVQLLLSTLTLGGLLAFEAAKGGFTCMTTLEVSIALLILVLVLIGWFVVPGVQEK